MAYGQASISERSVLSEEYRALIAEWSQKLHILESFNGRYFFTFPGQTQEGPSAVSGMSTDASGGGSVGIPSAQMLVVNFSQTQLDLLQQSYNALRESVYEALFYQTRFETVFVPLLDKIELVIGADNSISWDYSQLEQHFANAIAANSAQGMSDLIEFNKYVGNIFLPDDWKGNAMMVDYIRALPQTPALQALYADFITFVGASSTSYTGSERDEIIVSRDIGGSVNGGAGNDILIGNSGSDNLSGGGGNDSLYGGAGDDNLIGGAGNDLLDGGTGNEMLTGSDGDDTYVFRVGSGQDVVNAYDTNTGRIDTIQFADVKSTELRSLRRVGNDLVLNYGTVDQVTIQNYYFNSYYTVQQFKFSDDVTMTPAQLFAAYAINLTDGADSQTFGAGPDIVAGGLGNDTINGGGGNDSLYGGAGDDNLIGGAGNDLLDGGTGNDVLTGSDGDDTYIVDNTGDIIIESSSAGTDSVQSSVTYTLAANVENLTLTGTSAINGTGNALNNVITGNSANNILSGGLGVDTMIGGTGDDTYVVDNSGDVIIENAAGGTDTVQSSIDYTLGTNVENLTMTGTSGWGTGNALNNVIIGNSAANNLTGNAGDDTLDGGAGADTMNGGAGNDTYVVDNTGDVITENANEGTDTVQSSIDYTLGTNVENLTMTGTSGWGTGNELNNVIIGNSAVNSLTGNAGNDTLDGGAGADTMNGGIGNDTYVVDNTGDVITENANEGTDTVQSSITYTLASNVENLVLTGTSAINGTGNALNNVITGNSANNILSGGVGIDTMIGGIGNDTYVVDNSDDVITENANEGVDTVQSSNHYILGANVENLTLTGTTSAWGTGNDLNNVIIGNSAVNNLAGGTGNDTLDGGAGADSMNGGIGNDTFVVDNSGDVITENANEGTDTVQSSIDYTLGANVENLTLTGTSAWGTGNDLNNVITGNSANNLFNGSLGNDSLVGGTGSDTYTYRRTDGQDTINDYSTITTDVDTLQLKDGITSTEPVIVKQNGDLYIFVNSGNYVKIASQFTATTYGIERLEVSDGHYITRSDIESIVNTMSAINNNAGMDVMQKYNAMMQDQTYISTLAATWKQM
jgi:Ca2+-binding RTX toxin-like protein